MQFFPGSFVLWTIEMKWSLQWQLNEIWQNGACWECKWAGTDVPLHLTSRCHPECIDECTKLTLRRASMVYRIVVLLVNLQKGQNTSLVQRWHKAMKSTAECWRHSQPCRPCWTNSQQSWTKSFQAAQFQLAVIAVIRYIHSNKSTF